jgi:hypothetical protein
MDIRKRKKKVNKQQQKMTKRPKRKVTFQQTRQKHRSSSCDPKTSIIDPYTKRCLKLDMNGTIYNRYVLPFLLGNDSFLDAFSEKDGTKFELFLQQNTLLPWKK